MRLLIFPRGLTYFAPADRLGRSVAELVLNDTATRATAVPGCVPHRGARQSARRCSGARAGPGAEPLEKKIRVEGQKTGRVTALDLPGQIEQALRAWHHQRAEAQFLPTTTAA
jgi:acyl-CoA dehydrogenase